MKKLLFAILLLGATVFANEFELRVGGVAGSGTLELQADGTEIAALDGTTVGYKIQYGAYEEKNFYYVGYESLGFTEDGGSVTDTYSAFILGVERDMGNFILGGEFGYGSYDVNGIDLEFTAICVEPYIGAKADISENMTVNIRGGYKYIKLLDADFYGSNISGTINGLVATLSLGFRF